MDCMRDLEFHDDSGRALEKAKESIRFIKKKMILSNDLIVQYNNKLKECERLKGDLYLAQEEVAKLKRDNNANLSKVVRLEMQSADNKKARQELEQKIAERDIEIAGNKSHLRQLECKLEAAETQQAEKLMEFELDKSSMEVKVKELEQELKALKRSHQTEITKLERVVKSPKEKKGKKVVEVAKETKEIGVNTVEEAKQPQPVKPQTAEKSVMTNEFYHIHDDPYPVFCHRCQSSMQPKVEKICEIMAHPPLVGNMLSPVRPRVPERQRPNHNDSSNLDANRFNVNPRNSHHISSFGAEETNVSNTNRVESNPKAFNHVDQTPRNFLLAPASQSTINSSVAPVDATVPELVELRRKVGILERKIKKQKAQKSSDSQPPSANCCSHPHSVNCCGHSSTHVNPVPNALPNGQADLMTEFFNRMMSLAAGQRDERQKPSKIDCRRRERGLREKRAKMKLRKLKRMKVSKKKSNGNWCVESDECEAEETGETSDPSDPTKPHLLRIKPSQVDPLIDAGSEKFSEVEDFWEASFAEAQTNSPGNAERSPEKASRIERDSNQESAVKVPDKLGNSTRSRKTGKSSLFGDHDDDDGDSETEVETVRNAIAVETRVKRRKTCARRSSTRSESFHDEEDEGKRLPREKSVSEQQNPENSSRQSAIEETVLDIPASPLANSDGDRRIDAQPEINSDSEPSESACLQDRVDRRKRKRSGSPKATKRTGRSNLLGKLRALKKTSVASVAKTSNSSAIRATRSLSRRKLTEQSECEDVEGNSTVPRDEPSPCVPVKKQRIAHVPRAATQLDEREVPASSKVPNSNSPELSEEISKDANEKVVADCAIGATKRPRVRRSTLEKSSTSETKIEPEIGKIVNVDRVESVVEKSTTSESQNEAKSGQDGKVGRVGLPGDVVAAAAILPRRRGRPPGRKNAATIARLNARLREEAAALGSVPPNKSDENPSDAVKNAETSMGNIQDKLDQGKKSTASESLGEERPSSHLAMESIEELNRARGSSTPSISDTAESPVSSACAADKSEDVRAPPAEKTSFPLDASSASPAASPGDPSASPVPSLAPPDAFSAKPAEISISPKRSAVLSRATTTEKNKSSENALSPGNSILTDKTDAPAAGANFSTEKTSLAASAENSDDAKRNADKLEASRISLSADSANETTSAIPDHSPASPDVSPASPDVSPASPDVSPASPDVSPASPDVSPASPDSTPLSSDKNTETSPTKPTERLSIYDNVELPSLAETPRSTPLNYFSPVEEATTAKKFFVEETTSEMPVEKPIERNLLVYDGDLHDDAGSHDEDFDSSAIVRPQFFVETSTIERKKAGKKSGGRVGPTNVVKELRSRQVLHSPSTSASAQNAQRTPNPPGDETKNFAVNDVNIPQPVGYPKVRSLETLLNLHLSGQKKKSATVYTNLRRAGAIKLQEAAENNVRVELERLVEAEEWTTELHQSVITRILEIPGERTVAKSVVDFLVEQASLDEDLDRTHTPPAPIMTRTQQRIVTLMHSLQREETMRRIFDLVQAGIEYAVFNCGAAQPLQTVEYLVRIFTIIARIRKDRERVRIMCCDAFYTLGRTAFAAIHVILTVWPEVLPMHGKSDSELPNCLAHMIKQTTSENMNPIPKLKVTKNMITSYYGYPQTQATSTVVMTVLMKALHENYTSDLETAILLVSKREGTKWALDNVVEKGLMRIIRDDSYEWKFEVLRLLGFILRTFPFSAPDKSVQKYTELLCQMLDSGEGSHDKQEGLVSALLSLSRYAALFAVISESILKWSPSGDLRASTLQQLDSFFKSHTPHWWNMRHKSKTKTEGRGAKAIDESK